MELKAFDPHRQDFACVHEADQIPPIDPQAEAWLQEGMRITSKELQPNQRNYLNAAELWQQAADKQHASRVYAFWELAAYSTYAIC